jgi:hypothetical protein
MFAIGTKVKHGNKTGEVVAFMPDTWIRPVKVLFSDGTHQYYTEDGRENTFKKEVVLFIITE